MLNGGGLSGEVPRLRRPGSRLFPQVSARRWRAVAGRAWEGSERSLRLRAEVGAGRRPNLPPTQAAG